MSDEKSLHKAEGWFQKLSPFMRFLVLVGGGIAGFAVLSAMGVFKEDPATNYQGSVELQEFLDDMRDNPRMYIARFAQKRRGISGTVTDARSGINDAAVVMVRSGAGQYMVFDVDSGDIVEALSLDPGDLVTIRCDYFKKGDPVMGLNCNVHSTP